MGCSRVSYRLQWKVSDFLTGELYRTLYEIFKARSDVTEIAGMDQLTENVKLEAIGLFRFL